MKIVPNSASLHAKAFTLIELLVVVSILAILAGLLFPVFVQSKKQAKGTVCASNLRQIGLAVHLYQADYDDHYPYGAERFLWSLPASYWYPKQPQVADITPLLVNYSKSSTVFHCPNDTGFQVFDVLAEPLPQQPTSFAASGSSYWYNDDLVIGEEHERFFDAPSETLLYSDRSGSWHGVGLQVPPWKTENGFLRRHNGSFAWNVVFCDLHMRTLRDNEQFNHAKGRVYGPGRVWVDPQL